MPDPDPATKLEAFAALALLLADSIPQGTCHITEDIAGAVKVQLRTPADYHLTASQYRSMTGLRRHADRSKTTFEGPEKIYSFLVSDPQNP
jgi:hypothetical protein